MELAEARRRAEHEGAHATVALALGSRVVHVDLESTDVEPIEVDGLDAALNAVAVLSAGAIVDKAELNAHALGLPNCDASRAYEVARSAVGTEHVIELLRAGRRRAESMLEANADLHREIADALLEHGELDAAAIDQLLEERQPA